MAETISSILDRGARGGLGSLRGAERKVWLISEAEALCDLEGIDSFLDRYGDSLLEAADGFAEAGATRIAGILRAIHSHLPARPAALLDLANDLVTERAGYDEDSVLRLLSAED